MKSAIFSLILVFLVLFLSGCSLNQINIFEKKAVCGDELCHADLGEDYTNCIRDCPLPCSDSDGGETYEVKGTITLPGKTVEDKCFNEKWLIERFCNGVEKRVAETYYECPNGCVGGACVGGDTAVECFDSDSGASQYVFGYAEIKNAASGVTIGTKKFDACAIDRVTGREMVSEVYCAGDKIVTSLFECKYGCSYGACNTKIVSTGCVDTDGGEMVFVKGYVTNNMHTIPIWDSCSDDGLLLSEKYCGSDNTVKFTSYPCPAGCEDGKCNVSGTEKYNVGKWIENVTGIGAEKGVPMKIRIDAVDERPTAGIYDANLFLQGIDGTPYGATQVSVNDYIEDAFIFREGKIVGGTFLVKEIGVEYVSWLENQIGYIEIEAER